MFLKMLVLLHTHKAKSITPKHHPAQHKLWQTETNKRWNHAHTHNKEATYESGFSQSASAFLRSKSVWLPEKTLPFDTSPQRAKVETELATRCNKTMIGAWVWSKVLAFLNKPHLKTEEENIFEKSPFLVVRKKYSGLIFKNNNKQRNKVHEI